MTVFLLYLAAALVLGAVLLRGLKWLNDNVQSTWWLQRRAQAPIEPHRPLAIQSPQPGPGIQRALTSAADEDWSAWPVLPGVVLERREHPISGPSSGSWS